MTYCGMKKYEGATIRYIICCDTKRFWGDPSYRKVINAMTACPKCKKELEETVCVSCNAFYSGLNELSCSCDHDLVPYCKHCEQKFEHMERNEELVCPTCLTAYQKSDMKTDDTKTTSFPVFE